MISAAVAQPESRAETRSNIFVIATLYSSAASTPVRIRNMSRSGALVEGGALPADGTEVRLSRGSLDVSGKVVWCSGGRAGIRFGSTVMVADWLPRGNRNLQQQYVDEIVYNAKLTTVESAPPPCPKPAPATIGAAEIADELRRLANSLNAVGEELSSDPDVAARFLTRLQIIDIVAQSLARLAASVSAAAADEQR